MPRGLLPSAGSGSTGREHRPGIDHRVALTRVGAVFVDLDRTLLRGASGPAFEAALLAEGVMGRRRTLPGNHVLYALYERFGENLAAMSLARVAVLAARGWSQEGVRRAGTRAVDALVGLVAPYAPEVLAHHRVRGRRLVLATTTPFDLVGPFAGAMGFDAVIATRYQVRDGRYTGRLSGGFVWGPAKLQAVGRWARAEGIDLADCDAYSDSVFDAPLLSSVGRPHAVNPDPTLAVMARTRRWPVEHWDRPPGVPSLAGLEPYHLLRPFVRPETFPYARFDVRGVERIPGHGPVVLASNHRSHFDAVALALVAAGTGRPVRFLARRELFDVPVLGSVARSLGGIPVDRGSPTTVALRGARSALRAGEAVLVLPQGTIPGRQDPSDPILHGSTAAVRLAQWANAPVVPIGLWGTEEVWPRSSPLPDVTRLLDPPTVRVRVGSPVDLGSLSPEEGTERLGQAISALLPGEECLRRQPGDRPLLASAAADGAERPDRR